jgi:hypothetical protein
MDQRRRLERDIAALSWEEFQRMVHELAKKDHPNALPLDAPDGGADTLIEAEAGSPKEIVQAKHYPRPGSIKWKDCRESVESAIKNHDPARITFAFSRDFTANDQRNFRTKLVDLFPQVDIPTPWTLSEIIERLERHPDIKKRYLGRAHEEALEPVMRAIQHGAKLETGQDLIERARSLAVFAAEHDRDFAYTTSHGEATMPEPKWDTLPFMAMTVKDETTTVRVDAWVREGADVPPGAFGFTDDDEGRAAFEYTRDQLARGRDAVLTSGVRIQIPRAPKVFKEAIDGGPLETPEITICVSDSIPIELEVETADATVRRTFAARPVPAREPGHVIFACIDRALVAVFDFEPLDEPIVRFNLKLTAQWREDVADNLDAARLVHAFFNQKRSVLRAEGLFPNGELNGDVPVTSDSDRRAVAFRLEVYEDLALIEERTGIDFTLPPTFGEEDLAAIKTVVNIIRSGEGTATFHEADGIVEAKEIPFLAEQCAAERVTHRPVTYEVLGEIVDLGLGEYELPPLRVIEVKPLGTKPDSPAHVKVGPDGDDQMRFRLVDSNLRAA